jgi:hypothetical protein
MLDQAVPVVIFSFPNLSVWIERSNNNVTNWTVHFHLHDSFYSPFFKKIGVIHSKMFAIEIF